MRLDPVVVTDDLAQVLPYASYNGDAVADVAGDITLDGTNLLWEGALEIGEEVTITYTVTVKADAGGSTLENRAWAVGTPPGDADDLETPESVLPHPVNKPEFEVTKSVTPRDGKAITPGETITYTVVGKNTGETELDPVVLTDDLSEVLVGATYNDDATATVAGSDSGNISVADETLTWEGTLAVGESVTVTYSVTATDDSSGLTLRNVVAGEATGPGGDPEDPDNPPFQLTPPPAEVENPVVVPGFQVEKTADPTSGSAVDPNQLIIYTVKGINTGTALLDPVTVVDDLTNVLANAELVGEPEANVGVVNLDGTDLSWTGSLPVGEEVVITYTVKVNADAAGQILANVVEGNATPLIPTGDPENPLTPGEELPTGPIETEHPVNTPGFTVAKSVDPASGSAVDPGDVLTYTVTGENTGESVLDPVVLTDDLAGVLQHATFNEDAEATIAGDLQLSGTVLTWKGVLDPGESVDVTYSVTVNTDAAGSNLLNKLTGKATPPGGSEFELTPPPVKTKNPVNVPGLSVSKLADPESNTAVDPGEVVTYTVVASNTGETVLDPVVVADDLSGVLEYASYNGDVVAVVDGDESGEVQVVDGELTWVGVLQVDESVEITYSVTVADTAGGQVLKNLAAAEGTPPGGADVIKTPPTETVHPVNNPELELVKTVNPANGSAVDPGEVVTYTVVASNTGETVLDPVVVADDLSGVLEYASYNGDVVAVVDGDESGEVQVVDGELTWVGVLQVDESVEITYSVTVDSSAAGNALVNLASAEGTAPGGGTHKVSPPPVEVTNPVNTAGLNLTKTASPRSGAWVKSGETVRYTVTATNTGQSNLQDVVVTDDLSQVLPYAELGEIQATVDGEAAGTVKVSGTSLVWEGELQTGQAVTIKYGATVKDSMEGKTLRNSAIATALAPGGDNLETPTVETQNPVKGGLAVTGARALPALVAIALLLVAAGAVTVTKRGSGTRRA